jgi:hypothetical protein
MRTSTDGLAIVTARLFSPSADRRTRPTFRPPQPSSGVRRFLSVLQIIPLAAVIGAFLATAPQVRANTVVQFTLDGVTFQDNATLTGTFTVDETANTITLWNIVYTGGTLGVASTTFVNGGTQTAVYVPNLPPDFPPKLEFQNVASGEGLRLLIPTLLANTVEQILVGSQRTGTSVVTAQIVTTHLSDRITGGTLDPVPSRQGPTPVPEPPAGLILGGALGFFLLARGAIRRPTPAPPAAPLGA